MPFYLIHHVWKYTVISWTQRPRHSINLPRKLSHQVTDLDFFSHSISEFSISVSGQYLIFWNYFPPSLPCMIEATPAEVGEPDRAVKWLCSCCFNRLLWLRTPTEFFQWVNSIVHSKEHKPRLKGGVTCRHWLPLSLHGTTIDTQRIYA